ncbi:diguanylate cyclase [Colwellia psychrerythraea]|uniref:diguanylate cyclase n=2 Tax=Colwellia psychrerythraea TaxID=28229 RepID=A0A099KEC9_COLPS|nr:diguanylate cyclase [Colwellia psychrerythraea]
MQNVQVQSNSNGILKKSTDSSKFIHKLLIPFASLMIIILCSFTISLFYIISEEQSFSFIDNRATNTQITAENMYQNSLQSNVNATLAMLTMLRQDRKLAALFEKKDHTALYNHTEALYNDLFRHYQITHFYFTEPNRINLLRVHAPQKSGDRIDRVTTLNAQLSGAPEWGIELGVLGTITLRVVAPWQHAETGKLIGYIELGMELDHIFKSLNNIYDMEVAVIVFKEFLNEERWSSGMKLLNRDANWDQYSDVVIAGNNKAIPQVMENYLKSIDHEHNTNVLNLKEKDHTYWLMNIPIVDVKQNEIAHAILLTDVSAEMQAIKQTAKAVGITIFIVGLILIILFYSLAKTVKIRISNEAQLLNQLASKDGLTLLYNRRAFNDFLAIEINRSKRFNHPISLIMIDVDHFKKINDNYGHPAGDTVLKVLSQRLIQESRQEDYVCRYGGEEFAVILPETPLHEASKFANRLIKIIESLPIEINKDDSKQVLKITVSIGLVSNLGDSCSSQQIICEADKALYQAKYEGRNRMCIAK